MDKQEMFDTAVTKVWEQGQQCMSSKTLNCCYYDGHGNRCAVGWLLPEDVARSYSESGDVWHLVAEAEEVLLDYIVGNQNFLGDLQACHDNASSDQHLFKKDFKLRAEEFAKKYKLTMPILV